MEDKAWARTPCSAALSAIALVKKKAPFFSFETAQAYFSRIMQEAQRWMRIKKPPQVLALHLKRFKFIESLGRHKKLAYRVVFPQVR